MSQSEISYILIERGKKLLNRPFTPLVFTGNKEADNLLNDLKHHPHAFAIACLMDRQWAAEKCWLVPYRFRERFGSFVFDDLAAISEEKVISIFIQSPPLHRLKERMAEIFYLAIQRIEQIYSGDVSQIWVNEPSSATIVRRFLEFKGAGPKIATMAANILVREFKIPVSDKYSIDISADVQVRRTFERLRIVRNGASNDELIYAARELHPTYPGIFDLSAWEIGRNWCRPRNPSCEKCYMEKYCPTAKEGNST